MKRILCACALLSIAAFADTHPALKEAIDSKNYKQAENLIKNVGVKDIYCPETLAAKDADKIYGKIFADSIGYLLENCDVVFSRTYLEYKCAGGKDKAMCLNLINLTDPNSWPETYAKQFCTKKNVEICAAAVEKIPVEKSVPYLKAIKANKLAEMKQINVKDFRSGGATKKECLPKAKELYNDMLAQIQRRIDDANFNWRMARNDNDRYNREKEIKRWEEEKKELKAKSYSDFCSDLQNDVTFEKLKLNQYYFDIPFMLLTDKAARYYWDIHNPIIPGLAENWGDVDRLFEIANKATIKSIENMKDTLAQLTALAEFMGRYAKSAPYFIYKKNIIDNMKASFAKNEKIDSIEQLFYCKLYPSLDKETEKLFGMKIIDCKGMLEENKKIAEPCENDSRLFGGKVRCMEGKFEKSHWLKVNRFFVINDYDYQMSSKDAENLPGMMNFIKYGRLYSWDAGMKACPDGSRIPNKSEMQILAKYGKDLITPSKAGYIYENAQYGLGSKTIYMTSSTWNGEDFNYGGAVKNFNAATIDSIGNWNLKLSYKMKRFGHNRYYQQVEEKINMLASILCIDDARENDKCSEDEEGTCYGTLCCKNGVFKKSEAEKMIDPRDGKEYKTLRIGQQTWMAENLNYSDSSTYVGMRNRSWCYDNKVENCSKYGRLYTWAAAMDSAGTWNTNGKGCGPATTDCSPTYPVRGICPEGWHLPDTTDWKKLLNEISFSSAPTGKALKSSSDWSGNGNGTDVIGFSALPAGFWTKSCSNDEGCFEKRKNSTYFWTSSMYSQGVYGVRLVDDSEKTLVDRFYREQDGFSVRCVKD